MRKKSIFYDLMILIVGIAITAYGLWRMDKGFLISSHFSTVAVGVLAISMGLFALWKDIRKK